MKVIQYVMLKAVNVLQQVLIKTYIPNTISYSVHVTKTGEVIGTGEDTVYEILKELFDEDDIKRQYKFCELMNEEFKGTLGERQLKETIDIIVFRKAKNNTKP